MTTSAQGDGDPGDTPRLRVVSLVQTCPACPAQWSAVTDDGHYLYIRYRHGWLAVSLGDTWERAVSCADRQLVYGHQIGGEWDGELTEAELYRATSAVIDWSGLT